MRTTLEEFRRRHPLAFWLGTALGVVGGAAAPVAWIAVMGGGFFFLMGTTSARTYDLDLTWGQWAQLTWLEPVGAAASLTGIIVLLVGTYGSGLNAWQRAPLVVVLGLVCLAGALPIMSGLLRLLMLLG